MFLKTKYFVINIFYGGPRLKGRKKIGEGRGTKKPLRCRAPSIPTLDNSFTYFY